MLSLVSSLEVDLLPAWVPDNMGASTPLGSRVLQGRAQDRTCRVIFALALLPDQKRVCSVQCPDTPCQNTVLQPLSWVTFALDTSQLGKLMQRINQLLHKPGLSTSRSDLRDAYVELNGLQEYVDLNRSGFRKILKKYDKVLADLPGHSAPHALSPLIMPRVDEALDDKCRAGLVVRSVTCSRGPL